MDSSETASPTLSDDKQNSEEDSAIVPSAKRTRFFATYCRQRFPFRASIMRYIAENPTSPNVYLKMIKTCKFFFVHNPIIVLRDLNYNGFEWKNLSNLHWERSVDLEKIMAKLWITNNFCVSAKKKNDQNVLSSVIPKIFRFDAKQIFFTNQMISFNDYVYLTSSAEGVFLKNVTVKDENGTDMSLEKLVGAASKAKMFGCSYETALSNITSKIFEELLKLPHFLQLDFFFLKQIPESFDIEAFYIYMKKNKRSFFDFEFDDSVSVAYKNRLEEIIDEILATKNHDYFPPMIHFPGLGSEKFVKLLSMTRK